ncbi:hypothetical protein ABZP36_033505 [Zizania latifolia]
MAAEASKQSTNQGGNGRYRAGFLSIDCGLENSTGYRDDDNKIDYVPDGPYVDGGKSYTIDTGYDTPLSTLRSFPSGERNCYTLPTVAGTKYLVRVVLFYGNYDGKNSSPMMLRFDLHLGVNRWTTVYDAVDEVYEAVFIAWASWAPVCLIKTGDATPFVNVVELRSLTDALYPAVMANQSMGMYLRRNMAASATYRYPNDPYDRYWWPKHPDPSWANLSTASTIQTDFMFAVPSTIFQTAVTPAKNNMVLSVVMTTQQDTTDDEYEYIVFLHFADFQSSKLRQFDAYTDTNYVYYNFTPGYLLASHVYSSWFKVTGGEFNITIAATSASVLPPILNAFEIYYLITHDTTATFSKDFDAIMAIKLEYEVKKNWMGDPCSPQKFTWEGVKCRKNTSDNTMRIISIDLSDSNLHGVISNNFTMLTALENFLALEEAGEDRGVTASSLSIDVVSTFGPSAR